MHPLHPIPSFIALVLAIATGLAKANFIANGDFEAGDFTHWTLFTTPGGVLNPAVAPYSTNPNNSSIAARFQVGEIVHTLLEEGGGIYQSFESPVPQLAISVDVAVAATSDNNVQSGSFTVMVDGQIVDSFNAGYLDPHQIKRMTLGGRGYFGIGAHELRILITRPYLARDTTPFQFVDNVVVVDRSSVPKKIPEPGTAWLLTLALSAAFWTNRSVAPEAPSSK